MDSSIILYICLLLGFLLGVPITLVVLLLKVRRLDGLPQRIAALERQVRQLQSGQLPGGPLSTMAELPAVSPATIPQPSSITAPTVAEAPVVAPPVGHPSFLQSRETSNWEDLIGRQALGWVAVVMLLFAAGFFLRYAFENAWVGPLGRVTLGIVAGLALVADGWRRHRMGWRLFAQMLTAAGVVLLYLAMYGAFGFYHLVGQRAAGVFLFVLVAESGLLALAYEAPAIALMAVCGGLLTPLLMHSDRDQYVSLFLYLGVLNAGVVWLLLRRAWPVIGTVALLGTQALFWLWYNQNYHPEKLAWALGFEGLVFGLYLLHGLLVNLLRGQQATWEDVARTLLNASLWCAAAYVLLDEDYHPWLGSSAVAMAAVYALAARTMLVSAHRDARLVLVSVAIAAGFLATAFSLQTDASWVALGWAAEAAVLWWFGVRILSMPLRVMALVFAVLATARVLLIDTPHYQRPEFMPIFNGYALPALATALCLSLGLVSTRRRVLSLPADELVPVGIAAVGCALLPWYIVSIDLWTYFDMRSVGSPDAFDWHRLAQMSLSAWWSVYAAALLLLGFRARLAWLRWTALGLFAVTVLKVFLFDMSGLDQIYRIVAFFVLAILLGFSAWAYQRLQPDRVSTELS